MDGFLLKDSPAGEGRAGPPLAPSLLGVSWMQMLLHSPHVQQCVGLLFPRFIPPARCAGAMPGWVCRVPCCQPAFGRAAPALLPSAGTHPQQGLIPVLLCPCPSQGGFPGQAGAARACSHRCPAAMSEGWGPGNSAGLSSAALAHWEMLAAKAKFEKGALPAPLCQEPQRDGSVCPTQCPGCRS